MNVPSVDVNVVQAFGSRIPVGTLSNGSSRVLNNNRDRHYILHACKEEEMGILVCAYVYVGRKPLRYNQSRHRYEFVELELEEKTFDAKFFLLCTCRVDD